MKIKSIYVMIVSREHLIWDNGYQIIEVIADLAKKETAYLSIINKLQVFYNS